MSRENEKDSVKQDQEKKKKEKEMDLPVCTTAADPEHHRGGDMEMEEPCDDARSGDVEEE